MHCTFSKLILIHLFYCLIPINTRPIHNLKNCKFTLGNDAWIVFCHLCSDCFLHLMNKQIYLHVYGCQSPLSWINGFYFRDNYSFLLLALDIKDNLSFFQEKHVRDCKNEQLHRSSSNLGARQILFCFAC